MNFSRTKKVALGMLLTCAIPGSTFGFYSIVKPHRWDSTAAKVVKTVLTTLGLVNGTYHFIKTDKLSKEAKVTTAAALLCLDFYQIFDGDYFACHPVLLAYARDLCRLNSLRLVANFIYDRAEKAYGKIAGKADEQKPVTNLEAA